MTVNELRRIWAPPLRYSWRRKTALTLLGLVIGWASSWGYFAATQPAVYQRNAAQTVEYDGYLGIVIDRTRTGTCDLHPTRILFKAQNFDGQNLPVILPLGGQSFVWPVLGRARFVLLLAQLKDIPPGDWQEETVLRESCHWYDALTGGALVVTSPVSVTIK